MKIRINSLTNAFGIKKLSYRKIGKDLGNCIIYARNGVFKSSFARTLHYLSNGYDDQIMDRITGKQSICDIEILKNDGEVINNLEDKFLVFSREIYENGESLSDIVSRYDSLAIDEESSLLLSNIINTDLKQIYDIIRNSCTKVNLSYDKVVERYNIDYNDDISYLIDFFSNIDHTQDEEIKYVNTKKIFQKSYDIIDKDNFKVGFEAFRNVVNKRINETIFDDKFNEINALDFIKNVDKTNYLSKERKRGIILGDKHIYDNEQLKKYIHEILDNISNDPSVIESSKEFVNALGSNAEAEKIKNDILCNPLYGEELNLGRDGIIYRLIKSTGINTKDILNKLNDIKYKLSQLREKVNKQKSAFECALDIYINRFHPAYNVKLSNKVESLLGIQIPYFEFSHKSCDDVYFSEEDIMEILSSGERTTIFIIRFIADLLGGNDERIIILDDIVETFDYANKYAFIEYIREFINDGRSVIILTHNFEFCRSLKERIPGLNCIEAYHDSKNNVVLSDDSNIRRCIENSSIIQNDSELLFSIPYVREAMKILNKNCDELDNFLHYNSKTMTYTVHDLKDYLEDNVSLANKYKDIIDEPKSYYDLLAEQSMLIIDNKKEDLISKVILSIYIRITIEMKIIGKDYEKINNIEKNQLSEIYKLYSSYLTDSVKKILEKVLIYTPEFIHINAFMYEPLIDIEVKHLFMLVDEINNINCDKIWLN